MLYVGNEKSLEVFKEWREHHLDQYFSKNSDDIGENEVKQEKLEILQYQKKKNFFFRKTHG